MGCSAVLYVGNTSVVRLNDVTNSVTGLVDTGATVRVTVLDDDGVAVSGQTWPASMTHTGDGNYIATIGSSISITEKQQYTALVDATGSGGEQGLWKVPVVAKVRT